MSINPIEPISKKTLAFLFTIILSCAFFNLAHAEGALKSTVPFKSVKEMYEQKNLGSCSLFMGGFINFGYWPSPLISDKERIESEKNLYRHALKKLSITKNDKVLEVGCGEGSGALLAFTEFHPMSIDGIDFSDLQIAKAKKKHLSDKIFFQTGSAEYIPYPSGNFDKVFSIEAAQHFNNLNNFSKEAFRVLKPNGQLVVATFFTTSGKAKRLLSRMIQTIADGIDNPTSISSFKETLKDAGFKEIKIESIGKNVWPGFDQWISQQRDFKDTWNRNWYKAYTQGLIDYYLILAIK